MATINLPTKKREILYLDSLPSDLLISFRRQGQEIVVNKSQLLDLLDKTDPTGRTRTMKRTDAHNRAIAIATSLGVIDKALRNDREKAHRTVRNLVDKHDKPEILESLESREDQPRYSTLKSFVYKALENG